MIKKIDAMTNFLANSDRTEMLIVAMSKLKTYEWIYQQKALEQNLQFGYAVQKSQAREYIKIVESCSVHAIISLCTNFEVYYKDLLQELLNKFPQYFTNKKTKYQEKIVDMLSSKNRYDYGIITKELDLKNRFDFIELFEKYNLPFLTKEEKNFIEHIYVIRNNFVHSVGRIDAQTKAKLKKFPSPTGQSYLSTDAKTLRTKFNKLIKKIHNKILEQMNEMSIDE